MVVHRIGPIWMTVVLSHDALFAFLCALLLGYNWSGDIGAVSLCHLLAIHVSMHDRAIVVHPPISAVA